MRAGAAVLLALLGLASALQASGALLAVRRKADIATFCKESGNRHGWYCYYPNPKKYVHCDNGKGYLRSCKAGMAFDYSRRDCVKASQAAPCAEWPCPLAYPEGPELPAGFVPNGLLAPRPSFQADNITFAVADWLPKDVGPGRKGEFWVLCPFGGHCASGMVFKVSCTRLPMGVMGKAPVTHVVNFYETMTNAVRGAKRLRDLEVECQDFVNIYWHEPFHNAAIYYPKDIPKDFPMVPGPPEPSVKCPTLPLDPAGEPLPAPGVTLYPIAPGTNATAGLMGNITVKMTKAEEFWFFCTVGAHCRLGMRFKVTVRPAPANYKPKTIPIDFMLTYRDYEDRKAYVGDTFHFFWAIKMVQIPGGPMVPTEFDSGFHGLGKVKDIPAFSRLGKGYKAN